MPNRYAEDVQRLADERDNWKTLFELAMNKLEDTSRELDRIASELDRLRRDTRQ